MYYSSKAILNIIITLLLLYIYIIKDYRSMIKIRVVAVRPSWKRKNSGKQIVPKDVQCSETKSIFRFLRFLVYEI